MAVVEGEGEEVERGEAGCAEYGDAVSAGQDSARLQQFGADHSAYEEHGRYEEDERCGCCHSGAGKFDYDFVIHAHPLGRRHVNAGRRNLTEPPTRAA